MFLKDFNYYQKPDKPNVVIISEFVLFERWKIEIFFAWFDCWFGWFYDTKKKILFISLLPMVICSIRSTRPANINIPVYPVSDVKMQRIAIFNISDDERGRSDKFLKENPDIIKGIIEKMEQRHKDATDAALYGQKAPGEILKTSIDADILRKMVEQTENEFSDLEPPLICSHCGKPLILGNSFRASQLATNAPVIFCGERCQDLYNHEKQLTDLKRRAKTPPHCSECLFTINEFQSFKYFPGDDTRPERWFCSQKCENIWNRKNK